MTQTIQRTTVHRVLVQSMCSSRFNGDRQNVNVLVLFFMYAYIRTHRANVLYQ